MPALWKGRNSGWPKIIVNDAYQVVTDANIHYATDARWWAAHEDALKGPGLKVGYEAASPGGVVAVEGSGREGYDERLGYVRHGKNSGHVAVHLAAQLGASRIALIGYDMRMVGGLNHWFGEHPRGIRRTNNYEMFISNFEALAKELERLGIEVVNCTPGSAMKWFPQMKLDDVLMREAA